MGVARENDPALITLKSWNHSLKAQYSELWRSFSEEEAQKDKEKQATHDETLVRLAQLETTKTLAQKIMNDAREKTSDPKVSAEFHRENQTRLSTIENQTREGLSSVEQIRDGAPLHLVRESSTQVTRLPASNRSRLWAILTPLLALAPVLLGFARLTATSPGSNIDTDTSTPSTPIS